MSQHAQLDQVFMSSTRAAVALGCDAAQIHRYYQRGRLSGQTIDGRLFVERASVEVLRVDLARAQTTSTGGAA